MKSLYQPEVESDVLERLEQLQPNAQRQWGKMQVAQMFGHCCAALEVATGQKFPPRVLLGWLLGPFVKSIYSNEKPFPKNSPTDKSFIVTDERDFAAEKERLKKLIRQFSEGGEARCTTHPHCFFGYLTPEEWGKGMYKHLDHHFRQFAG